MQDGKGRVGCGTGVFARPDVVEVGWHVWTFSDIAGIGNNSNPAVEADAEKLKT